jgi:hypothetical protein
VTASGNGLSLEPAGQPAFPLYRSGDLTYLADTVHAELRFERGDDGTIAGLQLDQGDGPRAAQRSST